jgi:hypothetical protein
MGERRCKRRSGIGIEEARETTLACDNERSAVWAKREGRDPIIPREL